MTRAPRQTLSPAEVHVWYAFLDELDPELLETWRGLMAPGERDRHDRLRFPDGRHQFLVTRALVRTVLSRYAEPEPRAWTFKTNAHGRPEIDGPPGVPPLRFNLSNTAGLVACAVALDRDVGIDVEDKERQGETVAIADRYFAPVEVAALRALPSEARRDRFFEYWTLKESYIKARGLGLSIPLEQFSFLLEPRGSTRILFDPRLGDDPADWQFLQLRPSPRHAGAVAIRAPAPVAMATLLWRG